MHEKAGLGGKGSSAHWFLSISRTARSKSSLLKPASRSTASNLRIATS